MARASTRSGASSSKPSGTANPRVTRSQSRDLGDNDDTAEIGRQKTRQASRHTSIDSVGSEVSKSNRRPKANRVAETNTDLAMVEEDVEEGEEQYRQDEQIPSKSKSMPIASETSIISRSAALGPASQELSDLKIDLIIEALPSLNTYSTEIISRFPFSLTPEYITKWRNLLATPNSKLAQRMRYFGSHLKVSKANFGNGVFINNDFILQKLFGTQAPDVNSSKPDAIIYKANIAVLFESLLTRVPEREFMMNLDEAFPTPFMPAYYMEDGNDNETRHETFNLALDIRTQHTILLLQDFQGRDNFDPDHILAQIFYQDDGEKSTEEVLKKGNPRTIAGLTLVATDEQSDRIAERVDEIRQAEFDDTQAHATKEYVNLAELRRKFPWEVFLIKMIEWLQKRTTEHDSSIEGNGGAQRIVDVLLEEMPTREQDITLNFDLSPVVATSELSSTNPTRVESVAEKTRRLTMNVKEIYKLPSQTSVRPPKPLESRSAAHDHREPTAAKPSRAATTIQETPPKHAGADHGNDDESLNASEANNDLGFEQVSRPSEVTKSLATWVRVEKEKNKENNRPIGERAKSGSASKGSFLDSQVGAKKARFAVDEEEMPVVKLARPSRKRSQCDADIDKNSESTFTFEGLGSVRETEEEFSEDQGFVEDARDRNPRRSEEAARSLSNPAARLLPKRQRVHSGTAEPLNNTRKRQPEADDDFDAEDIAQVPSQSYRSVNTQAKRQVALSKRHTSQARVPWTSAECEALVDLISEYGNGWSTISKSVEARESIQERHRDQVALRDKGRNMKVDYLLSGSPLPFNFNLIALGPKERDKVAKAGFNPHRREGEEVGEESLNENGDPYE